MTHLTKRRKLANECMVQLHWMYKDLAPNVVAIGAFERGFNSALDLVLEKANTNYSKEQIIKFIKDLKK